MFGTKINVTRLEVTDGIASIYTQFPLWVQYLFWVVSAGNILLAILFFDAKVPAIGFILLSGSVFVAVLSSCKIEAIVNRVDGTVTYTTQKIAYKRQLQFPLVSLSLLAKIYSNGHGRYSIIYFVLGEDKYKIAELTSAVTDTVNDPVLDHFVGELLSFYDMPYEKAF